LQLGCIADEQAVEGGHAAVLRLHQVRFVDLPISIDFAARAAVRPPSSEIERGVIDARFEQSEIEPVITPSQYGGRRAVDPDLARSSHIVEGS